MIKNIDFSKQLP